MSRLRIFADDRPDVPLSETHDHAEMAAALSAIGVDFEQWQATQAIQPGDAPETIIAAYRSDIDRISAERGFTTIDVVSIAPDNPNREAMRTKFLDEHYHVEDEVRFFVAGSGLFSLHVDGKVYEVLCEAGDLISVPDKTTHWFDMGPEPSFVAIRFFQQADGWVGHFTGTDIAQRFPRHETPSAESAGQQLWRDLNSLQNFIDPSRWAPRGPVMHVSDEDANKELKRELLALANSLLEAGKAITHGTTPSFTSSFSHMNFDVISDELEDDIDVKKYLDLSVAYNKALDSYLNAMNR